MESLGALDGGDARAIIRLLGEMADMPGEIQTRKCHLLQGLARLLDADVWLWAQGCDTVAGHTPMAFSMINGGWPDECSRELVLQAMFDPEFNRLINAPLAHDRAQHITRARAELCPDVEWLASTCHRDLFAPAQIDDMLFSIYPLGPDTFSSIAMHRRIGRPRFTTRERDLLHMVAGEIDGLHRAGAAMPALHAVKILSPRLRQVFLLLLGGDGNKQIARKLQISEYTVADYTKALHRHFNVSSRGELLAKCLSGTQCWMFWLIIMLPPLLILLQSGVCDDLLSGAADAFLSCLPLWLGC